jgi:hypothetical protein
MVARLLVRVFLVVNRIQDLIIRSSGWEWRPGESYRPIGPGTEL